jgi:hypothetical protein
LTGQECGVIILSSEEATMLAVGMLWGKKGVRSFDIPKPDIKEPDEVLVRVKEAGWTARTSTSRW